MHADDRVELCTRLKGIGFWGCLSHLSIEAAYRCPEVTALQVFLRLLLLVLCVFAAPLPLPSSGISATVCAVARRVHPCRCRTGSSQLRSCQKTDTSCSSTTSWRTR